MISRPLAWTSMGLAGLLMVAGAGCKTLPGRQAVTEPALQVPRATPETASVKVDSEIHRAEFRGKPSVEQKINTHLDLARALEQQGEFEGAIMEYQKAIDEFQGRVSRWGDPKGRAKLHRRLASALDRLGRFPEAEKHYQTAQKLDPKNADIWNDAGYSYYLQGRLFDAEKTLRKATELDPTNPRIQTNLGLTLAAAGKTQAALEALTKASGPGAAHANLAYMLAALGKTEEARRHFQTALQIQPGLDNARNGLAKLDGHSLVRASHTASPTSAATAGRIR